MSEVDNVNHVLSACSRLVGKPLNLNLVSGVLHNLALVPLVEQVIYLTAIDFKEAHLEYSSTRRHLVEVIASILGVAVNSESLARTSLTVSKSSDNTSLEECREQMLNLVLIKHM